MTAAAPSRKTNSLQISWGLINIPVALYSGKEDFGIKRSEFTAEGHKVGRLTVDKVTGDEVAYADIVKMYEAEPERWVALSNEEIEAVIQPVKGLAEVEAFVPLSHLVAGTYLPSGLAQVRPDTMKSGSKNVPNPAAQKAFALLTAAMREEGVFALIKYVQAGKPQYAAFLPDGRFLTPMFDEEIRAPREMPTAELSEPELAMAKQLISALRTDEPPVLTDEATAKVDAYAKAKLAGGEVAEIIEPEPVADSGDLMALLGASIAASRPAA